ncbi:N-acetylmuramoyl-L-alanine amidase [Paenibacillus polygoni]|uniref:N-acetylmuramoyl-L-alanine amidase n=1 Tax=Paenibacillus polygoni TaxID=3050112 RepID=A0ABY8X025_9BACL|nr:N-acetylmuramoyl-L-alanine amidase [Paenibacillus polygoni]WIV17334.1 N-acetylmuramoyl-L-alanine amidase [Paenibacillus polygoni]
MKEANYHVLRETNMPAALLEIGFLSNYSDEKLMFTDSFQDKAAQAIVNGIIEFMK